MEFYNEIGKRRDKVFQWSSTAMVADTVRDGVTPASAGRRPLSGELHRYPENPPNLSCYVTFPVIIRSIRMSMRYER